MVDSVLSTVKVQDSYDLKHITAKSDNQHRSLLPKDMFANGEKILYESRAILWLTLVKPAFLSILGLLISTFSGQLPIDSINVILDLTSADMLIENIITWFGMALCVIGVIGFYYRWLRWRCTVYGVTNRRVIRKTGILARHYTDCTLRNIQTSHLHIPLLGRILGFGTITIATAGTASQEIRWDGIRKPEEAHRRLSEIIENNK